MAYNKQYNTRFSGRYNPPGQFVAGGESFAQTPRKQAPQNQITITKTKKEEVEVPMESESPSPSLKSSSDDIARPHWMKSKLPGGIVKKVTNRERRRRQNENLRRLLTPKNALMVLNEMMPNEQVANLSGKEERDKLKILLERKLSHEMRFQFKVEPAANAQYNAYKAPNSHTFCADLTIEGNVYKGYGDNKLMARNAAAEQAIRDLILKKMNKAIICSDTGSLNGALELPDEESLPMIQLASFALHKLFTEWEYEGHKVPQLKPALAAAEGEAAPKKVKELPANASSMHPCMLLTYMRPHLEYRELPLEGERPKDVVFTMTVDVDGTTYVGKARNKKEARKAAAKAACVELFNVQFENIPLCNTPLATL